MSKGLFITLEGMDGCGKTTQARLLSEQLTQMGYQVVLTREPGGTTLAEEIRKVILTPTQENLDPMTELLLYTASRVQHVNQLIKPALVEGKIVICERFVDSSLAYQGYGLGWDLELIRQLTRTAIGDFQPDLTFLLDIETGQGNSRVINRSNSAKVNIDRIEARGESFLDKVRHGFLALAAGEPRIILIEATHKSVKEIQHKLMKLVLAKMES
jgi:dTMP kinase